MTRRVKRRYNIPYQICVKHRQSFNTALHEESATSIYQAIVKLCFKLQSFTLSVLQTPTSRRHGCPSKHNRTRHLALSIYLVAQLTEQHRARTKFTALLPYHKLPQIWNMRMPSHRSIINKNKFKNEVNIYLLSLYSYNIKCKNLRCRQCFSS